MATHETDGNSYGNNAYAVMLDQYRHAYPPEKPLRALLDTELALLGRPKGSKITALSFGVWPGQMQTEGHAFSLFREYQPPKNESDTLRMMGSATLRDTHEPRLFSSLVVVLADLKQHILWILIPLVARLEIRQHGNSN